MRFAFLLGNVFVGAPANAKAFPAGLAGCPANAKTQNLSLRGTPQTSKLKIWDLRGTPQVFPKTILAIATFLQRHPPRKKQTSFIHWTHVSF